MVQNTHANMNNVSVWLSKEIEVILKILPVIFHLDVNIRIDSWSSQIQIENTELEWHEHTIYLISNYLGPHHVCPALCWMIITDIDFNLMSPKIFFSSLCLSNLYIWPMYKLATNELIIEYVLIYLLWNIHMYLIIFI